MRISLNIYPRFQRWGKGVAAPLNIGGHSPLPPNIGGWSPLHTIYPPPLPASHVLWSSLSFQEGNHPTFMSTFQQNNLVVPQSRPYERRDSLYDFIQTLLLWSFWYLMLADVMLSALNTSTVGSKSYPEVIAFAAVQKPNILVFWFIPKGMCLLKQTAGTLQCPSCSFRSGLVCCIYQLLIIFYSGFSLLLC